jgi:hypothetical protein
MSTQVVVLDDLTLVAPFGVRFWDVAAFAPAVPGLTMVAYPTAQPNLRFPAINGPSGAYSFADLPGLRRFENGTGDDAFWAANPPSIPYTMEVSDPQGRYLPFQFSVLLPVRGFYGLLASPVYPPLTPDATWLPVFSTPSRVMPGPGAIIRAQLQDDRPLGSPLQENQTPPPAAWAMVTAQFSGSPAMSGIADQRGTVTLAIPYPEPLNSPFGSPMGSGSVKLLDQSWPVTITVFYSALLNPPAIPDLQQLLQQGAAIAWADTAHSAPADSFTVKFGTDLILRSLHSGTGRELSVLLVTSATSPT